MKQVLIPKQELSLKGNFNQAKNESLKILSFNNDELRVYLHEQANQNPFMNFHSNISDSDAYLSYDQSKPSLYNEIMDQLHLRKERFNEEVCEYLLSQVDSNGYFKLKKDKLIHQSHFSPAIVKYHIDILHNLEPLGCFAFDLKDCLQIQCEQREEPASETAYILCNYLEELALKRMQNVINETKLTIDEIEEGFHFIQSCNPKPAANYTSNTLYIQPEFKVIVENTEIKIELLNDDFSISFDTEMEGKELTKFMKAQRSQVQNIISSIQKRNMTLLQIMQYICDVQKDYFLHHEPIVHLTLAMVSRNCGLHISTISRAITNKSFEFEQHYVPLKKMFSRGGCIDKSQDDIKKRMISLISLEDKQHPHSDETLRQLLEKEDICISRRAVAKYREACFIFNSSKRKLHQ